jgi:micrococcal nuclease
MLRGMRNRLTATHAGILALPAFSATTALAVLGTIVALGGTYGGYTVYKNYQGYGANFDGKKHELLRVQDGDTLLVRGEKNDAKGVRVRLLGIDAPEVGTCFADEATRALSEKLTGASFITQKDEEPMDDNERLLRHVFVVSDDPREGMRLVNEELLKEGLGFARLDNGNSQYDRRYAAAEREALSYGRGIWSACPKEAKARIAASADLRTRALEVESAPHKKGCDIKGNVSSAKMGKVYFLPRCPNYYTLIVDESRGEKYFCTEEEAKKAGFRKSGGCGNAF